MATKASFSSQQLTHLAELAATPTKKEKTSVTLSASLLRVVDALAGDARRSAWIEQALRAYVQRDLRRKRQERELALLNRYSETLNAEGETSAGFQAVWDDE